MEGLRGVSQETNDAWNYFISLFRRDCTYEGPQISHDLLPCRLELVNEQLFAISHCPGGVEEQVTILISHPQTKVPQDVSVVGSFHQIGLKSTVRDSNIEPFVKFEFLDQDQLLLQDYAGDIEPSVGWIGSECSRTDYNSLSTSSNKLTRKRTGTSSAVRDVDITGSDGLKVIVKRGKVRKLSSLADNNSPPTLPLTTLNFSGSKSSVKSILLENDILLHWKQFEMREAGKISDLEMGSRRDLVLEQPSKYFEYLINNQRLQVTDAKDRGVSTEEAHSILTCITAVAGPESLIQFKQALTGWRTRSLTTELMQTSGFIPVLKALNHLEAQNAFNAIATRIKLVQLAEAVDIANLTLPAHKGRGNPIVIWLSSQYRLFLRAEYPDLKEGSRFWNTKLDDIKRKVKAGRRWQKLIKLFGIGIISLVPSFGSGEIRNDFNKSIKTLSDPCFKLMIDTLELIKGQYVRQLTTKLENFILNLFEGNSDLPRLVLEYMDVSQIEVQPNCSPDLVMYLDIATKALSLPSVDLTTGDETEGYIDTSFTTSALGRLGLLKESLDEFKSNNKMSGNVMNAFMKLLNDNAVRLRSPSLFMDSDFLPGANRCLNCRSRNQFCDVTEQKGTHCTRCRCDGVICKIPKQNSKLDTNNFYDYKRLYIPVFTEEITHWSLVVIAPNERSILHYDSLAYPGPEIPPILTWALREVVKWVKSLIGSSWDSQGWQEISLSVPKQPPGGNDCGICTVMFCRLLQISQPFPQYESLTPTLMARMRYTFAKYLVEGKFSDNVPLSEDG